MYGLTRGLTTLIGAAIAGGLIWFATWIGPNDSIGEYWAAMGLVAGAGLVMALSQLLGGWTKWGVLGLGFLPALVVGGWILVAAQPNGDQARDRVLGWSADLGISGIVSDATTLVGAIAFGLGLVFGLVFDTTGPRRHPDVAEGDRYADGRRAYDADGPRRYDADEPTAAERERVAEPEYAETGRREPAAVGAPREERATPSAPQPEPEPQERPRRRFFSRK